MKVPDRVVILGDNESAVMAANKLVQRANKNEIEVIIVGSANDVEFKDTNIFVPTSLVDHHKLKRSINSQIKLSVEYVKDEVVTLNVRDKSLNTKGGKLIRYDYLLITNGFFEDDMAIPGFSQEVRTIITTQESLMLREDVGQFKKGEILIYQDGESIQSPVAGVNLAVLLSNYFKNKSLDKDVKITYASSFKQMMDNKTFHNKIVEVLDKNQINKVFDFKLSQINIKNKEVQSDDGKTLKFDLPIVIGKATMEEYLAKTDFKKSDMAPIEIDFNNLCVKEHPEIFIVGIGPKFKSSFWEMNYEQIDFITAKLAHMISGYPEPDYYIGLYTDYLLESEERATSFSIDINGEFSQGRASRSDYLLKLYSYHSYFGGYSQGYL